MESINVHFVHQPTQCNQILCPFYSFDQFVCASLKENTRSETPILLLLQKIERRTKSAQISC